MNRPKEGAERAYRLLLVRAGWQGGPSKVDYDSDIRDLLTDIRHLCDEAGVDYYDEDRIAYDNYLAERADPSD